MTILQEQLCKLCCSTYHYYSISLFVFILTLEQDVGLTRQLSKNIFMGKNVRLIRSNILLFLFQIVSPNSRGSFNDSNCMPPLTIYGCSDILP